MCRQCRLHAFLIPYNGACSWFGRLLAEAVPGHTDHQQVRCARRDLWAEALPFTTVITHAFDSGLPKQLPWICWERQEAELRRLCLRRLCAAALRGQLRADPAALRANEVANCALRICRHGNADQVSHQGPHPPAHDALRDPHALADAPAVEGAEPRSDSGAVAASHSRADTPADKEADPCADTPAVQEADTRADTPADEAADPCADAPPDEAADPCADSQAVQAAYPRADTPSDTKPHARACQRLGRRLPRQAVVLLQGPMSQRLPLLQAQRPLRFQKQRLLSAARHGVPHMRQWLGLVCRMRARVPASPSDARALRSAGWRRGDVPGRPADAAADRAADACPHYGSDGFALDTAL